jgi:hypothetical protein
VAEVEKAGWRRREPGEHNEWCCPCCTEASRASGGGCRRAIRRSDRSNYRQHRPPWSADLTAASARKLMQS